MKVRVDISIFTEDAAIGMVSGDIDLPIVPQVGDLISFDYQQADVDRHQAAFGIGHIKITDRLIMTDGNILLMLSDITVKTREDARQIIAFFEDCHSLFGDRWGEFDEGEPSAE